jgi:hypothetical protein
MKKNSLYFDRSKQEDSEYRALFSKAHLLDALVQFLFTNDDSHLAMMLSYATNVAYIDLVACLVAYIDLGACIVACVWLISLRWLGAVM